jgi:hypothetical protein
MSFDKFGQIKMSNKVNGIEIIEREYSIELKSDAGSVFLCSIEEINSVIDVLKYSKMALHKNNFFLLKQ